jgi:hypothetical protein
MRRLRRSILLALTLQPRQRNVLEASRVENASADCLDTTAEPLEPTRPALACVLLCRFAQQVSQIRET